MKKVILSFAFVATLFYSCTKESTTESTLSTDSVEVYEAYKGETIIVKNLQ